MGIEIERKFLVHAERWKALKKPTGKYLRQGYLSTDPQRTIRVRIAGNKGFLNIKGITTGATRQEFEYEIPEADAAQLLQNMAVTRLSKIRYLISHEGKQWEVDEFLDENAGLIVAEIELNSETEQFLLPDWAAEEVTDDARYYNSNLCLRPFTTW